MKGGHAIGRIRRGAPLASQDKKSRARKSRFPEAIQADLGVQS
jgi:hypothetical protein